MRIKDLTPDIFEQLVELECQNILPILASVGINLTPQHMRDQLEFFKESHVVLSEDSGQVNGFVMYEVKETEILLISFNLKKFNNFEVLSTLLKGMFEHIQEAKVETIKSHAHHTNKKSLNFHRKMGFKEIAQDEHQVTFEASKHDLLAMIAKRT